MEYVMKLCRILAAITLLSLAPIAPAFAYTIGFTGGNAVDGSTWTTPEGWASVWTFNSGNLVDGRPSLFAGISGTPNAAVVKGSISGQYAAPGTTDTTFYLAVPAPAPQSSSGSITVDLSASTNNYFGLYWGSIDTYNSISFFRGNDLLYSFSGDTVVGIANANGNQISLSSNTYVNFYDLPAFDRFTLTSSGRAFEVDNVAVGTAPVPEPATMFLFGTGLLGLAGMKARKKK